MQRLPQKLYFIRHGETDWNVEGRLQGQRDIPLNDLGRVQAEEAGRRLAKACPMFQDLPFISSPLSRTRETMEILRGALGLHPPYYRTDARLKEIGFGQWEGLTWKEVRRRQPGPAAMRDRDRWRFEPPEGESYQRVAGRAGAFLAELEAPAIVVAHGGVARTMMVLFGALNANAALQQDIHQGQVLVLTPGTLCWA